MGTTGAVYTADNLPPLSVDTIITLWDINPENLEKWKILKSSPLPWHLDEGHGYEEEYVEMGKFSLTKGGETYIPINTSQGLMGINRKLLTPIANCGELEFVERKVGNKIHIAVKRGILTLAIIEPAHIASERLLEVLNNFFVAGTKKWLEYKQEQRE